MPDSEKYKKWWQEQEQEKELKEKSGENKLKPLIVFYRSYEKDDEDDNGEEQLESGALPTREEILKQMRITPRNHLQKNNF